MGYLFEIIDPYSVNRQGIDVGEKYRTGVYSTDAIISRWPAHGSPVVRTRPESPSK